MGASHVMLEVHLDKNAGCGHAFKCTCIRTCRCVNAHACTVLRVHVIQLTYILCAVVPSHFSQDIYEKFPQLLLKW